MNAEEDVQAIYWIEDSDTVCGDCAGEGATPVLESHGAESDTPAHCAHCETFLENPLTSDGIAYVAEALEAHEEGDGRAEILVQWARHYAQALRDDPAIDVLLDAESGADDIEDDERRSAVLRAAVHSHDRDALARVRMQMRIIASPDIAEWLEDRGCPRGASHGEDVDTVLGLTGRALSAREALEQAQRTERVGDG